MAAEWRVALLSSRATGLHKPWSNRCATAVQPVGLSDLPDDEWRGMRPLVYIVGGSGTARERNRCLLWCVSPIERQQYGLVERMRPGEAYDTLYAAPVHIPAYFRAELAESLVTQSEDQAST